MINNKKAKTCILFKIQTIEYIKMETAYNMAKTFFCIFYINHSSLHGFMASQEIKSKNMLKLSDSWKERETEKKVQK